MPIEQNCPHCGRVYRFPDKHLGTQVKCPGCSKNFSVTGLTEIGTEGERKIPKLAKPGKAAKPEARPAPKKKPLKSAVNAGSRKPSAADKKFPKEEIEEMDEILMEDPPSENDVDLDALKQELKEKKEEKREEDMDEPKHEISKSFEQLGLGEGPVEKPQVNMKKGFGRIGLALGFPTAFALVIIRVSILFDRRWWSSSFPSDIYEKIIQIVGLALLIVLTLWFVGRLLGWAALGFRGKEPASSKRTGSSARDRMNSRRRK